MPMRAIALQVRDVIFEADYSWHRILYSKATPNGATYTMLTGLLPSTRQTTCTSNCSLRPRFM